MADVPRSFSKMIIVVIRKAIHQAHNITIDTNETQQQRLLEIILNTTIQHVPH
jgi:hypothetical protein